MTVPPDRILWGFSSLGAPQLDLRGLDALAREHGLDFLELRAVGGSIELPDYFRDHPAELRAASTPVRVLATNLRLTEAKDQDIAAFSRFVGLGKAMNAPWLRVFGGEHWGTEINDDLLQRASKTVASCREILRGEGASCEMILETHSGFSSAKICRRLNDYLPEPLAIIWDSHHTWKLAGETLNESWDAISPWVRHVHLKDSVLDPAHKDGYQYVPPGRGRFPTRELLDLLKSAGYRGGVSLEWEKLWRPELPDIGEALAGLRDVMRDAA
jgi:sugar phosphate isomerase/epimerase